VKESKADELTKEMEGFVGVIRINSGRLSYNHRYSEILAYIRPDTTM
jgi:hypothetical protein